MTDQIGNQLQDETKKIVLLSSSVVKIGDDAEDNQIKIEVTNKTNGSVKSRVTVTVGCGPGPENLLNSENDDVYATFALASPPNSDENEMTDTGVAEGKQAWQTRSSGFDLPAACSLLITLKDFRCDTFPGTAKITVKYQVDDRGVWKGKPIVLDLAKKFEPPAEPRLHFFRADPDYILNAGQKNVMVSFLATEYETAILYRNNEQVKAWAKNEEEPIAGDYTDSPSITSVYRLQVKRPKTDALEEKTETLLRTVQVISPGWNRIALTQGSPTRLFVASDFTPNRKTFIIGEDIEPVEEQSKSAGQGRQGDTQRLYGIFYRNWRDKNNVLKSEASLHSSGTGVDSWRKEPGIVPRRMETSPGVFYKNRLWLIGGSAVDPDKKTKEIWCYERKAETGSMDWRKTDLSFPPGGAARFGHCCVVLGDEIWVLGGFGKKAHKDVWRLKASGNEKIGYTFNWVSTSSPDIAPWDPRCMHTAATVRSSDGEETLWVYGGAKSRGDARRRFDLWSKEGKDGTWTEHKMKNQNTAIAPDPGEPVGSALAAYPEGVEGTGNERLILLGSFRERQSPVLPNGLQQLLKQKFSLKDDDKDIKVIEGQSMDVGNRICSSIFEWQKITSTWKSSQVSDGWQQFQGQTFSMQALAFNRFLYIYSLDQLTLYPDREAKPVNLKLNIRIPS